MRGSRILAHALAVCLALWAVLGAYAIWSAGLQALAQDPPPAWSVQPTVIPVLRVPTRRLVAWPVAREVRP